MSPVCSRLEEVRQALAAGHWPHACAPDLRAHAETCSRCAQEVLLTTHFQQSRTAALAAVPADAHAQPLAQTSALAATPSLLWWRAQVRRRNAALTRAGRPLAAAQIFALIIVAAVIAGVVIAHWSSLIALTPKSPAFTTILSDWGLAPLILAGTLITTLSGLALYLTTDRN